MTKNEIIKEAGFDPEGETELPLPLSVEIDGETWSLDAKGDVVPPTKE